MVVLVVVLVVLVIVLDVGAQLKSGLVKKMREDRLTSNRPQSYSLPFPI